MNNLESYRVQHSLTYEALAARVGMPKETVWRHCKGVSNPESPAIAAYMRHLGFRFEDVRPDLWAASVPTATPSSSTAPQPGEDATLHATQPAQGQETLTAGTGATSGAEALPR